MKNLKKVLAFVVVFAMMFTCAVSASAFPDVADTASYAEATTILSSLGLMIGDDLGNFNPDKVLTRAEATALVMRAKGLESAAAGAAGATQFADVPADHWASGYINLAAQSGVVAGYGNGMFGPEDQVLYEQFVKMIVVALGYEPMAAKNGGYPSGYLIIASQNNITKNAAGAAGQPAVRSTVAVLLFNALEVKMMKQTVFTVGAEEYGFSDDTLLETYLHIDKYEGVVTEVDVPAAGEENIDTLITITYTVFNGKVQPVRTNEDGEVIPNVVDVDQADAKNAAGLLGYSVVAYVGENEYTREPELFAIAARTGRNSTVAVDYTQLEGILPADAVENDDITTVSYRAKETDKTPTKLDVAGAKFFVNGQAEDDTDTDALTFLEQTDGSVAGTALFLDNNADNDYEYVFVTTYGDAAEYLVGEVGGEYLIDKDGNDIVDIDVESESTSYSFFKNGAAAAYEDIKVGDVLTVVESADGKKITVYIADAVVEGKVTETGTAAGVPVYTINGVDYKVSTAADTAPSVAIGDEGKFYLNVDGRIAFKEAVSTSSDNYAYLLAAEATTGISGSTVEIKFINAAGEWGIYELASRVSVYMDYVVDDKGTEDPADDVKKYKYESVEPKDLDTNFGILTIENEEVSRTAGEDGELYTDDDVVKYERKANIDEANRFFQYELNSAGKVKSIWIASEKAEDDDNFSLDAAGAYAYKASTNKLGNTFLSESTKVFSINSGYVATGDERAVTIANSSMFSEDAPEDYEAYIYDKDINGYPAAIVVIDAAAGIDPATHPFVLTKVTTGTNAGGYTVAKFYGYQAGEVVEAQGAEELEVTDYAGNSVDVDDLEAGDVVIFSLDAAGDIDKIEVIMTAAVAKAATEDDTKAFERGDEEEILEYFGLATKKETNNRVTINGEVRTLRGAELNYYTVNLNREPYIVNTGAYGDIVQTTATTKIGKTATFVYVREYEGTPVAAVVYEITYDEDVRDEYYPVVE